MINTCVFENKPFSVFFPFYYSVINYSSNLCDMTVTSKPNFNECFKNMFSLELFNQQQICEFR